MAWPFPAKAQQILEPSPAIGDRLADLETQVRACKAALDTLNAEMLAFRTENNLREGRFGQIVSVYADSVSGRGQIEREWRVLCVRRDKLTARWYSILKEWSALRMAHVV